MNYWEEREKLLEKVLEGLEGELSREYLRCLRKTRQDLVQLYNELINETGEILISDLYRYNRYYELMNNLNEQLQRLGIKEVNLFTDALRDYYLRNCEIIGREINWLMPVEDATARRAIEAVWCSDGKHWSERIWSNMGKLEERVKDGLIDCIARGAGKDEMVKQLMDDFNVGFNQADRIARTELSYIQNKSTLDKYEQAGIEKYRVLANQANDESCGDLDGKEFFLHEAKVGETFPPFHPNCKCTILAVL